MSKWSNHEGMFKVQNGKPVHPTMSFSTGYSDLAYGGYREDAGVEGGFCQIMFESPVQWTAKRPTTELDCNRSYMDRS
jgi:hypothetical protein